MTQNCNASGEALKHILKPQQQLYGLTCEMSRLKKKKNERRRYAIAKMHSVFTTRGEQMTPST